MESIFCKMALLTSLFALPPQSSAQAVPGSSTSNAGAFRTDRLSPRQIKLWNSIRKIVLAPGPHGRLLHPTLYGLWRTVEQSSHSVFVELITDKERSSNIAGESVIEKPDPTGHMHTLRLRLFIPTIDRAYAGEQAPQEGMEFVPFAGLRHEKRYAKVLGHELAHIARAIRDPGYLRLLQEICMEQSAIAAGVGPDGKPLSDVALRERLGRIWPLVLESEKPAVAAEREIRRELLAGQR